jgi:hypothetical protein
MTGAIERRGETLGEARSRHVGKAGRAGRQSDEDWKCWDFGSKKEIPVWKVSIRNQSAPCRLSLTDP